MSGAQVHYLLLLNKFRNYVSRRVTVYLSKESINRIKLIVTSESLFKLICIFNLHKIF